MNRKFIVSIYFILWAICIIYGFKVASTKEQILIQMVWLALAIWGSIFAWKWSCKK